MNIKIIPIVFAATMLTAGFSFADTIYFTNGGTIEGIVKSENADIIEIDVGFGTITCARNEIGSIERSDPAASRMLTEKWAKRREELKASEAAFELERKKRFEEYERQDREERERAEREAKEEGTIDLTRDQETKGILVDAVLNENIKATLVLDTGASIVVLTKRMGEQLGVDLSDPGKGRITLQLAGDHKVDAKLVMLKSVRIKDIEVKGVMAGVLLDDAGVGLKDGLLGMTFLNRFNLKIDLKNMKMSLEKTG
ncbi:MAG: retropepsin-like aspartic protease [Candidatus Omnitrophica bacterium]|nr:retropepsin-like aspartic protease [Candidatus Omnitrophota bacterium]